MKAHVTTAALILAVSPAFAQTTGVSHPDDSPITADSPAKPSPAVPLQTARRPLTPSSPTTPGTTPSTDVYGPYIPYKGAATAAEPAKIADPDAEVVTSVPDPAGEVREGTLIHVRIQQQLSTTETVPGTRFTAVLTQDIAKSGRVIMPAGSILNGQVTEVHSGRRITGPAAMHLEAHNISLPDGTQYPIHAQLIDLDDNSHSRVDNEGTLIRRDHAKETLAVMGGTTGAAAVAGAVAGGGLGAAVGAVAGAGVSTVWWLKQDRQETLPKDSGLIFSLTLPLPLKPSAPPMALSSVKPANPAPVIQ